MARTNRFRLPEGFSVPSKTTIALGGGVMIAAVAAVVGLTPGISVGVLSNPVAPVIVPPASVAPTATTVAPSVTAAAATGAPSTAAPTKPSATPSSTAVPAAATTVAPKGGQIRIAAGAAQQGRPVTLQASGLRPNETVTIDVNGRKFRAKADARGVARISYPVSATATTLVVKAAAPSGTRTATVAVKAR